MKTKRVLFADLRETLESLGFKLTPQPTHWLFEHAMPDTLVICRRYRPGDPVLPHDLAATRLLLDQRGLMAAPDFDRVLAKTPA